MQTTYTKARENLASLLDKVVDDREILVIERRGKPNVALIAEDELISLQETAYLLRSPKNAARLLEALEWSKTRDEETLESVAVDEAIASLKAETRGLQPFGHPAAGGSRHVSEACAERTREVSKTQELEFGEEEKT